MTTIEPPPPEFMAPKKLFTEKCPCCARKWTKAEAQAEWDEGRCSWCVALGCRPKKATP